LFVRKYRQRDRELDRKLRCALCRQLNPALNLKLDLNSNPSLNQALLATLYVKSDPSLFASLHGALYRKKCRSFDAPICLQPYRQLLLPRRPPHRGVDGRIVVRVGPCYHL
jgi:hypothetical protein